MYILKQVVYNFYQSFGEGEKLNHVRNVLIIGTIQIFKVIHQ